jgi:hypothetical protein
MRHDRGVIICIEDAQIHGTGLVAAVSRKRRTVESA